MNHNSTLPEMSCRGGSGRQPGLWKRSMDERITGRPGGLQRGDEFIGQVGLAGGIHPIDSHAHRGDPVG